MRPARSLGAWLGINLGLAGAYAFTGNLGLHWAIQPGNITAAWPPSGLALAAVLVFGNRVLPGIFLGSLLVNSSLAIQGQFQFPSSLLSQSLHVAYALGALAQAWLGAALIRRARVYPSPLDAPRDVGLFLLLGGPVACFVNSTWSVGALALAGVIPGSQFGLSWFTWWVGDTLGVLAFAPLALVWGGEPREAWRKRRFSMTLPLLLTYAMSAALFLLASRGGNRDVKAWAILCLGLMFSSLLGTFLLTITGRSAQVDLLEAQVAQRTEDLRRALQEAETRTQELEDLDQTVKAINQELNLKGLLDALLRALVSHFPQADVGVFLLRDDDTGHFHIVGMQGATQPVPPGFHFTEEEVLARYTQGSEDLGAGVFRVRPGPQTAGQSKAPQFADIRSLLAMSVELQGRLAGFLVLDNLRDPEAFRDADVAKLHRFREHVISAITKLRTLHDLERAKELALEAARAKSHFLANMSHEIRTPMNAILGFAALGLKQDFPPRAREYFQKIANSGASLLGVINDILDFSKIEAGKLELEQVPFDLPEVLAQITDLFAHMAMDKHLELVVSAGVQVPRRLTGDPLRLGQILINLTGNALKFTERGQVHVRVDVLDKADGLAHLHFAVQDSGIGISPEQQALVFSAFSQADTSNTRRFGGTGLGLSISKRLVEMMGGELFVQSEYGVGSTFAFSIRLPFDPDQPEAVPRAPGDLVGLRVLVVDDNPIARDVLVEQLRAFGFEVRAAASAEAALEALREASPEAPFSLLLLDWKMPGLDGLEALDRIQAATAPTPPRIILCTAFGQDALRQEAASRSVAGFLPKPLGSTRLLEGILAALGRGGDALPPPTSQPSRGPRPGFRGMRILLVEDNPINQEVASEILRTEGIGVEVAGSGPEALQALDRGPFDAVLMDIQMPGMDGYETTARIRERAAFRDLPIIAMTAHAMAGYREECLAAGMNDYLTKPVDPQALFQVLARWVGPPPGGGPAPVPADPEAPAPLPLEVPGFDLAAGLRRVGGKAALFRRLVSDFARDYAGAGAALRAALREGDRAGAGHLAHTVRGVAGNLSATELQAAAGALEHLLREPGEPLTLNEGGPPIPPGRSASPLVLPPAMPGQGPVTAPVEAALDAFDSALARALEGARTLGPGPGLDADGARRPSEAAAALLKELQDRLRGHDPRAEESLESLRACLADPRLQAVADCLGSYDFPGAAEALSALKLGLGGLP